MVHQTFYRLPDDKKERILAAAHREFAGLTYEKTSINRILAEANIPKGSFYQYFDDKSDLFYLCIYSVYEKIIAFRACCKESLLGAGLLRMMKLGYDKGYEIFSSDMQKILDEEDFALFNNMLQAPAAIRNYVQMNIASELIAPVFKEELKSDPAVRKDIDYDYYAYLLSLTEVLPADYGARTGRTLDETIYLGFEYMKSIYNNITR
ncbi:MAG: TetR/AcrR family transcriptional regulator [Mogibacterium sp.]|nr:TetR/AcrR family transcriptional regulator [Mogibacterium sp.]